ncbi:MAG: pentapeptide repeat-containing protein [Cyanobacteria bacterium J06597_1]
MSEENIKQLLIERYEQGERDFRSLGDRLKNANLSRISLEKCNLSGMDLSCANLSRANLNDVNLQGTDLSFANFVNAKLVNVDFGQSNLTFATFSNSEVISCQFSDADLSNANLLNATVRPPSFAGAIHNSNTRFPEGVDLDGKSSTSVAKSSPSSTGITESPAKQAPQTSASEETSTPKKKRVMFRGRWVDM